MSRTLALFTIVALALSGLSSAAPLEGSNAISLPTESAATFNVSLEKRGKHHGGHRNHRKDKKRKSYSSKRSTTTTKKRTTTTKKYTTTTKKRTTTKTTKTTTTTKLSSSGGSSSSGSFTGTATWFKPATEGGSQGACGPEEDDDSYIVALNAPQYGNMSKKSPWCGKKLRITGPKGTVDAIVNDACPGCDHGDLDLTPILFKQIVGDMNIGVAKITWHEV